MARLGDFGLFRVMGRLPLFLLLLASAPLARAQTLAYADLDAPRLHYADMLAEPLQPPGPVSAAAEPREPRFFADRIEARIGRGGDGFHWDLSALLGGDVDRLFLAATGDGRFRGGIDYVEVQALYSRAVAEGFDLQAGLRADFAPRPRRFYLAAGGQGDLGGPFYGGAHAFLSTHGELSARLFGLADLPLGGRLVLQPYFETEFAADDVPALGIGRGFVYAEGALRLRWEIARSFAPYAGVNCERLLGRTRRLAREEGEGTGGCALLLGLRSWL